MIKRVVYDMYYQTFFDPNSMDILYYLVAALFFVIVIEQVFIVYPKRRRHREIIQHGRDAQVYTVPRVLKIWKQYSDNANYVDKYNFRGLYILHNKTQDRYFVGTDARVIEGVVWHIHGDGYREVYQDIKAGDDWTVRFVRLDETEYSDIKSLWMTALGAFNATNEKHGYN